MTRSTDPPDLTDEMPPTDHHDDQLLAILDNRRAALTFGFIVFLTTTLQVLLNPFAIALAGDVSWSLPLPFGLVVLLVVVGAALQAASLILSVRLPEVAVFASLACYLLLVITLGVPAWLTGMQFVAAIALFLLAARRSSTASVGWFALAMAVDLAALFAWANTIGADFATVVSFAVGQGAGYLAPAAGATALGVWWASRSRRVAKARTEAEASSREHEERIERARDIERARIAQELHDVAGQHLAGLITLADAAVSIGPARVQDVLQLMEDVRAEGRFAAASLYGALADLRTVGGTPIEQTRNLRRTQELVGYWRQRGMPVELHMIGELSDLPAVVSTTAYRGVQESLTNASKHAAGARVDIDIVWGGESLQVVVENAEGDAERAPAERIGLGWGLKGLRDRVELINGTVTAGPTDAGGWRVRMRIPVHGQEAADAG